MKDSPPLPCVLVLLLGLTLSPPAEGTSFVLVGDGDLADAAGAIAEVHVVDVDRSPAIGRPVTDYGVAVDRLLSGRLPHRPVVVRVSGGVLADGTELRLWGAPRFRIGERALVFLKPQADGTYAIAHFMQGAFHIVERPGERIAVRNLSEAHEVRLPGREVRRGPRDLERFRRWLIDRRRGLRRPADYFLEAEKVAAWGEKYTLREADGLAMRWRQFDRDGEVTIHAHADGQPGLAGGGFAEFELALGAWTADPETPIRYLYGGTTTLTGGFVTFDSVNAILFNDPNDNPTFDSPFSCSVGGIIALGGPWTRSSLTHTFQGETFRTILNGDVVTNKGLECWLPFNHRAEEIFAHELGHTLGLGHSCGDDASGPCDTAAKNQALMRATAHGDGRGASLGSDDRAGIAYLYRERCLPGATAMCLNGGRFRVEVSWRDFTGRTGEGRVASPGADDSGLFWFFDPDNWEMLVKVLDGCGVNDRYWLFAAATTNVEYTLRVTDSVTGLSQSYFNPLGTAAAAITDTNAFTSCP